MQFVKTEDIKTGMRLARPIYNRNGVLLYERDSKVTSQAVSSIKNFGLLGIYILEPAEPVPPMTKEDLEFERFQTMVSFTLEEELEKMLSQGVSSRIQTIAGMIMKSYGHLNRKITFHQNLRSRENYTYRHSLNVAILCALMTRVLNIKIEEQLSTIMAALVHDMGKLTIKDQLSDCDATTEQDFERLSHAEATAWENIGKALPNGTDVKRICGQSNAALNAARKGDKFFQTEKMSLGAKILAVAGTYDSLTAMQIGREPVSEIKALRYMIENDRYFDPAIVNALLATINVLVPGICVELNNKDKAVVIKENKQDIFSPMLLVFGGNRVIDLSSKEVKKKIWIQDIMKTLDNRYIFDMDALVACGYIKDDNAKSEKKSEKKSEAEASFNFNIDFL